MVHSTYSWWLVDQRATCRQVSHSHLAFAEKYKYPQQSPRWVREVIIEISDFFVPLMSPSAASKNDDPR